MSLPEPFEYLEGSPKRARDQQVGGTHYLKHDVQPWDAMRNWMTPEQFSGFLRGCIIKYIARYRDKSGVEDLKKAQHYLTKLIEEESKCPPIS